MGFILNNESLHFAKKTSFLERFNQLTIQLSLLTDWD